MDLLSVAAITSVFYTHDQYDYDQVWLSVLDQESIVFRVRACGEAHIGLARYPGISNVEMYEVVIGGWTNTKSAIRRMLQGALEAELDETGILHCNQSRTFWINWPGGRIAFGRGSIVGQREMLYWQDPNPRLINGLGFTTSRGFIGTWEFSIPART